MSGEATENPPAVGSISAWTGLLRAQLRSSLSRARSWRPGLASSHRSSSEHLCVHDFKVRNGGVATEAVIALAALKHDGQFHLVLEE